MTVTRQICEAIKDQIRRGVHGPGARLPSTRALAAEWGVSRTTVTAAYGQLIAEGYLETRQGARATVVQGPSPTAPPPQTFRPATARLSAFGQRVLDLPAPAPRVPGRLVADFRYGDVAAADFPTLAWRKAINAAILRRPARLGYGDPAGSSELRAALQGYLWRARGLRCDPDQIVVVNGSQQGLDLCARLLLDPGDGVLVENPGYGAAREIFSAVGAMPLPVDVDGEGMRTEDLGEARLAYVTPSHQFPLGGVMSATRRRELLSWARRSGAYVIEDDYDSEYRYDIAPLPALQALDGAETVLYLGTVSKTLSPTLRLGYLVVPPGLRDALVRAKRLSDRHSPALEQDALADLIVSGAYERHVRSARRRNRERRAVLLASLSTRLRDDVTVVGADAGLHVVVWLNCLPREREDELLARAAAAGLGLYPVSPLYDPAVPASHPGIVGLVMGYASLSEREIEQGVDRLASVLEALAQPNPLKLDVSRERVRSHARPKPR
ncbi:PLP-dependent aminotransferase family protein [Microvirga sp. VF16]|uniref:MocR-like pyridoxine biosynthesis transcription factor PdxR n=1 Tax=Microvirga sp. VF16 TaxID=2807101 RepID=UPI00193D250B|nr:PLP-dependent aminotransferase family protein [Microvirga sp. VF16]QRM33341.1 PLP-dependent aminotransferase family protein [Microvirga sp. VF16]